MRKVFELFFNKVMCILQLKYILKVIVLSVLICHLKS